MLTRKIDDDDDNDDETFGLLAFIYWSLKDEDDDSKTCHALAFSH